MSYHKTRAGEKDGSSGTIHVAPFHPEPRCTYFVDDSTKQESKVDTPAPSVTSVIRRKLDYIVKRLKSKYTKKGMPLLDTEKSIRREGNPTIRLCEGGSYSSDRLLNAHGTNLTPHPANERLPLHVTANLENNNGLTKKSMTSNSEAPKATASQHAADDYSLPFFGEEFNVNSAAAVSAAALKDAVQKAQESIQIAKKMMERKMGRLQNRSDRLFKDGLRVKERKKNSITHEGNRTKHINAKETWETVDSVSNYLSGRWKSTFRHEQDAPDFQENEITFTSRKVIGDVNSHNRPKTGKRESALATILNVGKNRTSSFSPNQQVAGNREIAQFMYKHEGNANERNITKETLIKQEIIVEKEEEDETSHELGSIRNKLHADVTEKESAENVDKPSKHVKMENLIFQEDGVHVKSGIESQQKIEYEMKNESHVFEDADFEKVHITQKQDLSKQHENSQQEDMKKKTAFFDELREYRPRTICHDDIEDEIFDGACEWVQDEDEPIDFLGSVINDKEENVTYMEEVTERGRRVVRVDVPTNEEKRSIDVHYYEESAEKFEELKLIASKNGFKSYGYEKHENKQIGTNDIEVLQNAQYGSGVIRKIDLWSHDTSDNITETQGSCQPCMIDESSKTEQVNDTSRIIDKATNNVYDFKVGEAEETKVASKINKIDSFETATLVQGGGEDSETGKHTNTVFEVLPSEGSIPKFGHTYMDLTNSEAENRDKGFKSNINCPDISNGKGQPVVVMKNFKAYSGPSVHSEHEKVIQVDEEMRAKPNTQMTAKSLCKTVAGEEDETKSDEEMKTEKVVEVNEDTPEVLFAMEGTETKKEKSKALEEKEYLRKVYEERKRERQRKIDRIAAGRVIQEARDRAFARAREKAERATVERATADVRQRSLAETRGKREKATTAVRQSAEKDLIEAKLRSERAAVERATAEARERALEKAISQKNISRTQVYRRPDDTYIESAQRSKARLERQERIMERVAKALAEKNMRDLLAQKEEAEKNRLAESLDAQIKRWSTGKEGNLRALLSTLQYILGPGSGWQPISLTDIITSNAVKKAYRKATLCVHPDKLQQRGASIREKYICEKVFDLLKVGWARFSSEER